MLVEASSSNTHPIRKTKPTSAVDQRVPASLWRLPPSRHGAPSWKRVEESLPCSIVMFGLLECWLEVKRQLALSQQTIILSHVLKIKFSGGCIPYRIFFTCWEFFHMPKIPCIDVLRQPLDQAAWRVVHCSIEKVRAKWGYSRFHETHLYSPTNKALLLGTELLV